MKNLTRIVVLFNTVMLLLAVTAFAETETFDTEKMKSELEKHIALSKEQWEKLKPILNKKSLELKQSMQKSIDKGYVELEELTRKLDAKTKDAEASIREMMSSEDVMKLKEYLSKVDEQAIRDWKDKMVKELTSILELTNEQAAKLKPVLDDTVTQMSALLNDMVKKGNKTWKDFREQFDQLSNEFMEKMRNTLDKKQMQKFKDYNQQQKEKIHQALFNV